MIAFGCVGIRSGVSSSNVCSAFVPPIELPHAGQTGSASALST
jgi:hypothetical protein